jgi:hypothetical protein
LNFKLNYNGKISPKNSTSLLETTIQRKQIAQESSDTDKSQLTKLYNFYATTNMPKKSTGQIYLLDSKPPEGLYPVFFVPHSL